jgi:hypothetical protein
MCDLIVNNQLPAKMFIEFISKSTELDDYSKIIIQKSFIEIENTIIKNKNRIAFNNWSKFITDKITKFALYYYNYEALVPRLLNKIWDKLSDDRKEKWINVDYTDNYPYLLILYDYTVSDCDIIYQSYKSYMEEKQFYLQFNLIITTLLMRCSLNNEYLLSYIVENIIIHMQRRIIKLCKSSVDIRKKIIKILIIYKENGNQNIKSYLMNTLKKITYYDKFGGLISLNVTFNDKNQIKYYEKDTN